MGEETRYLLVDYYERLRGELEGISDKTKPPLRHAERERGQKGRCRFNEQPNISRTRVL